MALCTHLEGVNKSMKELSDSELQDNFNKLLLVSKTLFVFLVIAKHIHLSLLKNNKIRKKGPVFWVGVQLLLK